jgi:hypothetical protein
MRIEAEQIPASLEFVVLCVLVRIILPADVVNDVVAESHASKDPCGPWRWQLFVFDLVASISRATLWAISRCSGFAWPSISSVQSTSLPLVNSFLASEPNTTTSESEELIRPKCSDKTPRNNSLTAKASALAFRIASQERPSSWRSCSKAFPSSISPPKPSFP